MKAMVSRGSQAHQMPQALRAQRDPLTRPNIVKTSTNSAEAAPMRSAAGEPLKRYTALATPHTISAAVTAIQDRKSVV